MANNTKSGTPLTDALFRDTLYQEGFINNKTLLDEHNLNLLLNGIKYLRDNKVSEEEGKVLSTNDFTNDLKEKLDGIQAEAQKNVTPDQDYDGTSENAQSGKAVAEALTEFTNSTELEGKIVSTVSYNGYATTSQVEHMHKVLTDQTYTPDSEYPQSGKAVAQAIADIEISGGGSGTVDQTYDSTSPNAQSGIAVAEALSEKPGQKTSEGGIIFNDYTNNTANKGSVTIGTNNKSQGENNFVSGKDNTIDNDRAKRSGVFGSHNTLISGSGNIIAGEWNKIDYINKNNNFNILAGDHNKLNSGYGNLITGYYNTIISDYSIIAGKNHSIENGSNMIIAGEGHSITEPINGLIVSGSYANMYNSTMVFLIGGGSSASDRKNVFEVHKNGDTYQKGNANISGSLILGENKTNFTAGYLKQIDNINDKADKSYVDNLIGIGTSIDEATEENKFFVVIDEE